MQFKNNLNHKIHKNMVFPVVILAAGKGERMGGKAKPLMNLLGLSLIERTILTFREAGIKEFYVVVGYKKEEVIEHLEKLKSKYKLKIKIIENDEWEKGNGTSVLAVKNHVNKFFLTMSDHIFDPEIVKNFVRNAKNVKKCILSIDKELDKIINIDEATKVMLDGENIKDIGKNIENFNAVDMGLFFCQSFIFDALEKSINDGDASLTGGIKILSKEGKIKGLEKDGNLWLDIDTPKDIKIAEKLLITNLHKPEDGYISFYINRKFSQKLSAKLCNFNIKPNSITLISFLIAIMGSYFFFYGKYFYTIIAGILIQFSSIIDGCDGEISRLKFLSTPIGAWLDTMLDRYADSIIVIGITYGYWINHKNYLVWILGFFAIIGFILASYSKKEYQLRHERKINEGVISKLSKRDVRLFTIFIGALINLAFESIVAIAIIHHVSIAWEFIREKLKTK